MPNLIVLSGKKQHGKDTTANILYELLPEVKDIIFFADPLKKMCQQLFPVDAQYFYGTDEEKDTPLPHLEPIDGFWKILLKVSPDQSYWTGRLLLQAIGTEVFRAIYPNVWADAWKRRVEDAYGFGTDTVICTDCRFPNEVQAAETMNAHILRIERINEDGSPWYAGEEEDEHPSETALDDYPWKADQRIQACSVEELKTKVTAWAQAHLPISHSTAA